MASSGLVAAIVILLVIALIYYIKVVRAGSTPSSATTTVKEGGVVDLVCAAPGGDQTQPPSSKNAELHSAKFGPPTACKTYDVTEAVQGLLSGGVPFNADAKILLAAPQYAEWSAAPCSASSTSQLTINYACPVLTSSAHTSTTTYGHGTGPGGRDPFATSHPAIEIAESHGGPWGGDNYRHTASAAPNLDLSTAAGGKFEEVDVAGQMFHRKRLLSLNGGGMRRSIYSQGPPTDADLTGLGDALDREALGSTRSGGQISGSHWALPRPKSTTNHREAHYRRRTVT